MALMSACSSLRFSWIDAITGRVGGATLVELRRVSGITGARDDEQILPLRRSAADQPLRYVRVVQRDDKSPRVLQMQPVKQFRPGHVAVIDLPASVPLPGHQVRVLIN